MTPACSGPESERHATRSSGCCSTIVASNSRSTPPTLTFQCVWVSSSCSTDSTPSMNRGNDSNWVHWLYVSRRGTSTSTDSVMVAIRAAPSSVVMTELSNDRRRPRQHGPWCSSRRGATGDSRSGRVIRVVTDVADAMDIRAVGATVDLLVRQDAVTDHRAATVRAPGRDLVDRAFEAVEG